MYTTDYTTAQAIAQMSYPMRYKVVAAAQERRDGYMERANKTESHTVRDSWIDLADTVDDEIETDLVQLFSFTRSEIVDYWDMTRVGFDAATAVERIIEAREERDARATINSLIWAM